MRCARFEASTALEVWQLVRPGALSVAGVCARAPSGWAEFDTAMDMAASLTGLDYAVLIAGR